MVRPMNYRAADKVHDAIARLGALEVLADSCHALIQDGQTGAAADLADLLRQNLAEVRGALAGSAGICAASLDGVAPEERGRTVKTGGGSTV